MPVPKTLASASPDDILCEAPREKRFPIVQLAPPWDKSRQLLFMPHSSGRRKRRQCYRKAQIYSQIHIAVAVKRIDISSGYVPRATTKAGHVSDKPFIGSSVYYRLKDSCLDDGETLTVFVSNVQLLQNFQDSQSQMFPSTQFGALLVWSTIERVACLFGLIALRTSYVTRVAWLFQLVALRTHELLHMCSMLVSTHRFKNELCYILGVIVSTQGLKNELCYRCSVLVLAHGTTRLPEIPSESICFQQIRWTPSDDFPTLLKVFFTHPVSSYDQTSGNSTGLECTSAVSFFDQSPLESRLFPLESS